MACILSTGYYPHQVDMYILYCERRTPTYHSQNLTIGRADHCKKERERRAAVSSTGSQEVYAISLGLLSGSDGLDNDAGQLIVRKPDDVLTCIGTIMGVHLTIVHTDDVILVCICIRKGG